MVLAAVDDLLFRSKIRTVAKQAGVEITFVKTRQELLDRVRILKPSLVILDLNDARSEPVQAVTELKQDPELASVRTMGFVSHVHTEIIKAAHDAGLDDVLARSTFAANLAEILQGAGASPAPTDG
jgi:CheY-like chemotaxis protein